MTGISPLMPASPRLAVRGESCGRRGETVRHAGRVERAHGAGVSKATHAWHTSEQPRHTQWLARGVRHTSRSRHQRTTAARMSDLEYEYGYICR